MVAESTIEAEDDLDIDRVQKKAPSSQAPVLAHKAKSIYLDDYPAPSNNMPQKKKTDPAESLKSSLLKLNLAAVIVGLISASIILFCFIRSYRSFDRQYFPFESIQESWRNEVITAIDVSTGTLCDGNSQELILGEWSGTNDGCDCTINTARF